MEPNAIEACNRVAHDALHATEVPAGYFADALRGLPPTPGQLLQAGYDRKRTWKREYPAVVTGKVGDVPYRAKRRALERLYKAFGLKEQMTPDEVRCEAYLAYKMKLITKDQARLLGCSL